MVMSTRSTARNNDVDHPSPSPRRKDVKQGNLKPEPNLSGSSQAYRSPNPRRKPKTETQDDSSDNEDENNEKLADQSRNRVYPDIPQLADSPRYKPVLEGGLRWVQNRFRYYQPECANVNEADYYRSFEEGEGPNDSYQDNGRIATNIANWIENISTSAFNFVKQISGLGILAIAMGVLGFLLILFGVWPKLLANSADSIFPPVLHLQELKTHFPNQEDSLWKSVRFIFEDYVKFTPEQIEENGPKIVTLMLLDREGDTGDTSDCLIDKLVKGYNPEKLDGKHLMRSPYIEKYCNEFIDESREFLPKKQIMVVKNLHLVPSALAEKFHFLCDEINPSVSKIIFIFKMTVKHNFNKPVLAAEAALKNAWTNISSDKLEALIARLTSEVFFVKVEPNLRCF